MLRKMWVVCCATAVIGCGSSAPNKPPDESKMAEWAAKNRTAVLDDASLSDLQAIKKYLPLLGELKPTVLVKGTRDRVEVKEVGGGIPGYMAEVKVYDLTFFSKSTETEVLLQLERDSIKQAAEFCENALRDLKGKNLKAISYQIFSMVKDQPDTEIFRVTVVGTDVPKLEKARGKADAGTAYDPRGPKVNELWKVEKNTYSQYVYEKK